MTFDPHGQWFPIAAASDLPPRHVYQAQLLGREFAVWRADDGHVNVWENRCLHRGVRLSIGINDGRELQCQYHGWRYANRTAGCTYIPAHPADAPARTICNNTYPAQERHGLIWACEAPQGEVPELDGYGLVLRAMPLNSPRDLVIAALLAEGGAAAQQDGSVLLRGEDGHATRFFVQPVDSNRSVIRGLSDAEAQGAARIALLRDWDWRLEELRARIEAEAATRETPEPMQPQITRLSEELAALPAAGADGRQAEQRVRVAEKVETGKGVIALRLEPLRGSLATFQPGAHIDVHLPNGLVRQYSLTNGPGQTDHYRIGVKREAESGGGSAALHDQVQVGDVLAISAPRNNFPLRRDAVQTIFIAGGIGVTPLLSMARALQAQGLDFAFHYFVQSPEHAAFAGEMAGFGAALHLHAGLTPQDTGTRLAELLATPGHARHVYLCGPGPMLEAARGIAADQGWPESAVHFEYFKNTREIDDSSSFEIDLARSAMSLTVPAGRTILEVLRENGVDMPSSCEQGACGTCRVAVIEGEITHQDVYLSPGEKAEGKSIMTCVSRAASGRLILDI
ncbi:Rieske 2Fe-2S domain-containing protein [Sulfitobacter aestuarii]|uniref:Rieske 2Fe-2S domain-containing protein n=1 Tax=Sulfitobacter aestuarii TaxID=2161676 RepID=A0ABW5U133_9RHOB